MPTGAVGKEFYKVAGECGYQYAACVDSVEDLQKELQKIKEKKLPAFLEVKVKLGARVGLGRPKESAVENKEQFMGYHFHK